MTTSASSGVLQMNAASGNLWVGGSGTGTLNVTGGYVSNASCFISNGVGSVGTATVSSGTWATSGELRVGNNGTGTLNVTGGYVSNVNGFIGAATGGVGTATVSSGTWFNSGDLALGGRLGTGTLTMNGGLVIVASTLSKNGASTINLNSGGTLQIGVGGKRVAAAEEFAGANGVFDEVELNAGEQGFDGAEDLDAFGHDFGADSIAGNNSEFHDRSTVSTRVASTASRMAACTSTGTSRSTRSITVAPPPAAS
jgi:T5SS/PEP-CTERM-associated repeat protein